MTHKKMKKKPKLQAFLRTGLIGVTIFALTNAAAQTTPSGGPPSSASASSISGSSIARDPNPYFIGVSQEFTHESNVYRIPDGPSGEYSSTSIFGGFDQPISRQRLFGNARVTLNRYRSESDLNNTSYSLGTGIAWETIYKLSGTVSASLDRSLAAPAVVGVVPQAGRNIGTNRRMDARARWGGASTLTVEGALGYARSDYSLQEYVTQEARHTSGSLGLYYRPGGLLRLGVAGRVTRTETPQAMAMPLGGFQGNTVRSRNLDLLADYAASALISTSARLSYTRQTNSLAEDASFSGLTGNVNVSYRPGGKLGFNAYAARDAGFNTTPYTATAAAQVGPIVVLTPVSGLYQNNQVTTSFGGSVSYAATAKISAAAGARYSRGKLSSVLFGQSAPETTDVSKLVYLSTSYAISRRWDTSCRVSHESRSVSGGINYSYTDNIFSCQAQYTWR
jgi:hypothetical protein